MKTERAAARPERVCEGLGVSPGLALGAAHVTCTDTLAVPEYEIPADEIGEEVGRFEDAVALSRHQLAKLKDKSAVLHGSASEEVGLVLEAHIAMLGQSRLVRGVDARIRDARMNAEAAVRAEIETLAEAFAAIDDGYLAARIDDVRSVGTRLIRNLTRAPFRSIAGLDKGTVLLADELTPADAALIDPVAVAGFATLSGGPESHTAIMARALGLPAVLGCGGLLDGVVEGDPVIIDGFDGSVTINPSAATLERYREKRIALDEERRDLDLIRRLPAISRDGIAVTLQANLELPLELERAVGAGAAGIGLVRTEFLYMNRDKAPGEDEQFETLAAIVEGMRGQEVTIRTLDIGGDKLAFPLGGVRESPNPALGLRAVRLGLQHRDLLETQLAAILRVAALGKVRVLLPMISNLAQVREIRRIMQSVRDGLAVRGARLADGLPPLGIMIEIPGAALAADAFAAETDFFAIGTNDLTQYTLAIDRGDEQVADLFNPLHPAVLRLIQFATAAATRAGIPVSVCGEVAGDPRFTPLLLGLGIRTLSMAPGSLARVKQRIRHLTLERAEIVAARIMAESDEDRIAQMLDQEMLVRG
ncbi:MAG TPA: phosphoenolpyruvate--protein phosphotransferase [Stellaceae bacterium]|nr:phosphoenolpyruvate--protein phosphotransferase [Stellaceae bacterium]